MSVLYTYTYTMPWTNGSLGAKGVQTSSCNLPLLEYPKSAQLLKSQFFAKAAAYIIHNTSVGSTKSKHACYMVQFANTEQMWRWKFKNTDLCFNRSFIIVVEF